MGLCDESAGAVGVGVDLVPGQAEGHAHGDETRLDAVVQVAFDASALQLGGADGTGALLAGGADSLGELAEIGRAHV